MQSHLGYHIAPCGEPTEADSDEPAAVDACDNYDACNTSDNYDHCSVCDENVVVSVYHGDHSATVMAAPMNPPRVSVKYSNDDAVKPASTLY